MKKNKISYLKNNKFRNFVQMKYIENIVERQTYKAEPYKNLFRYCRTNYDYLVDKFENRRKNREQ